MNADGLGKAKNLVLQIFHYSVYGLQIGQLILPNDVFQ